jgi:hypothetical protein
VEFEIVLYPLQLRQARYPRPCVVIDPQTFDLMAVTTKPYEKFNFFTIDGSHPDFPPTNLAATSYVIGSTIVRGNRALVVRKIGSLTGDLAAEFSKWLG